MTPETLYKIRYFLTETRRKSLLSAQNAHLNGYRQVALDRENEAAEVALLLKELADEHGESL